MDDVPPAAPSSPNVIGNSMIAYSSTTYGTSQTPGQEADGVVLDVDQVSRTSTPTSTPSWSKGMCGTEEGTSSGPTGPSGTGTEDTERPGVVSDRSEALQSQMTASSSRRSVSNILTQRPSQFSEVSLSKATFMGIALQDTSELPSSSTMGRWERTWRTAKYFPMHILLELQHYVVPILFGLLPTVVRSLVAVEWLELVRDDFDGRLYDLAYEDMPLRGLCLSLVGTVIIQIGCWGMLLTWLMTLWSTSLMSPFIKLVPCFFFLIVTCVCCLRVLVPYYLESPSWVIDLNSNLTCIMMLGGFAIVIIGAGRAADNLAFKFILFPLAITCALSICIRYAVPAIVAGPDLLKVIVVALVNPLLCEVLLIRPGRFVARSLRFNDPSTSFTVAIFFCFVKQYVGRTLVALIEDWRWVSAVSAWMCVVEIVLRLTLKWRDRNMYKLIFSRWLPPGYKTTELLEHRRNRTLRAHIASAETIGEIVAIWNGVAMVIAFDVSLDGESPMSVSKTFQTGLVQTAFEILRDFIVLLMLSFQGVPEIDLVRGRYWYWSVAFAFALMFISAVGGEFLSSWALCHKQNFSAARFVACSAL